MQRRVIDPITRKWRPPLALVIGGTLAAVLCLPLLGIGYFKLAGNILGWGETSWLIAWMAVVSTVILGFLLWRLVLRPVYALTTYAKAVKEGHRDLPLPPHFGTPELTALGEAVHDMATTLQSREAGIRAYSDHVTHEMKSPLTSISAAAELLSGDLDEADRVPLLDTIRTSSARMERLLNDLRRLAAARTPMSRGPSDLDAVVAALSKRTPLEINVARSGLVSFDADGLLAVLEQLAQNSVAHGAQSLTLHNSPQTLHIQDDGTGIFPGDQSRIFDPFFTTRRDSGGTGLGLAIVQAILESSGASIALVPSDHGTAFDIRF
ncbi:ATP-binding protein [Alisedimentitalea sp. MJ-SS2]|uniref:sensor histidine kinase n=1 Tax=Aliisedimentitalea sp. MJ-SS2 TaxID=3049795 RepID=UPI00290C1E4F|nr:ATP-binding protein [Alisedimentitalea sp. MJ-SS2]MDU8928033.1 ATP-binding protein [Alisedimentitalea sp. MJ-SS2]